MTTTTETKVLPTSTSLKVGRLHTAREIEMIETIMKSRPADCVKAEREVFNFLDYKREPFLTRAINAIEAQGFDVMVKMIDYQRFLMRKYQRFSDIPESLRVKL